MVAYRFKIRIPDRVDAIVAAPVLVYRRLRYGYSFRRIPLTEGQYTIVEQQDYYWLAQYSWSARKSSNGYRAARFSYDGKRNMTVFMHREILNPPRHLFVDHINHDGLDNRRANLRLATRAQNNQNRRHTKGKTSKYKGVHWDRSNKRWRSQITANMEKKDLGSFKSELEAARAYDKAARKYHGRFASPNFTL